MLPFNLQTAKTLCSYCHQGDLEYTVVYICYYHCEIPKSRVCVLFFAFLMCVCVCVCVCTQSCLTLCNRMDCSPPGSCVHGISQARILQWGAIPFSRGSFPPHELWPARLLCPWDFPGKNAGVGCHFLLQGIFPTQRFNPCLLHLLYWQAGSLTLHHLGSP